MNFEWEVRTCKTTFGSVIAKLSAYKITVRNADLDYLNLVELGNGDLILGSSQFSLPPSYLKKLNLLNYSLV